MKLEEALKYRRKGYDISRATWAISLFTAHNKFIGECDVDADD